MKPETENIDKKTIIVAEDSKTQAQNINHILCNKKYNVILTRNGLEALEECNKNKPDLIISDIAMPEMNGYEFCKVLKSDNDFKNIPIILLTTMSETADIFKGLEAGVDHYITKPFDEKYLLSRIDNLINNKIEINNKNKINYDILHENVLHKFYTSPQQLLNLLLSTYENTININKKLLKTQLNLRKLNEELDQKVKERTEKLKAETDERILAIKSLNETEEKYRGLINNISDLIYIIDLDYKIIFLNKMSEHFTGYQAEEIFGQYIQDYIYKDDVEIFIQNMEIAKNSLNHKTKNSKNYNIKPVAGIDYEYEFRLKKINNETIWISFKCIPLYDHGIEIIGFSGVIRDITERKKTEEVLQWAYTNLEKRVEERTVELKEMNKKLEEEIIERKKTEEALIESEINLKNAHKMSHIGIWEWDIEKDEYIVSNEMKNIYGIESKDNSEIKELIYNLILIDDREKVKKSMNSIKEKSELKQFNYRIKHNKNNDIRWIEAKKPQIKKMNGIDKPAKIIGVIQDVTERKKYENEIKISREKAEIANKSKGLFLANMSHEIRTPMNGIMGFLELLNNTMLNDKQKNYIEIIRKSSNTLLGIINDILDFSKIESGKIQLENIKFNLKQELHSVVEIFSTRAEEKKINLIIYIDPNIPNCLSGDPLRIKQVITNLLSNAIKFTRENGNILLEILVLDNNIENSTLMFSVSDTGIGIPKEKQDEIFKVFVQQDSSVTRKYGGSGLGLSICKNLVTLMNGELKLKSIKNKGSRFYFNLNLLKENDEENNNIIDKIKWINIGIYENNNEDNLQYVVLIRYLLSLKCQITYINIDNLNSSKVDLLFLVGCNLDVIKQCNQKKIKTVCITDHSNQKIVKNINTQYHGVLNIPLTSSKLFDIIMKLTYGEKTTEIDKEEYISLSFEGTALVAEDNDINQELIIEMFKELSIKVDIANNGLEACNKYKNNKYDIIFMDIHMPVLDGIETSKKIIEYEKNNNINHIPIIALTAKAVKGDKEKILSIGIDDYLSKPIIYNDLITVLKKYLKENSKVQILNKNIKEDETNGMNKFKIDDVAKELRLDKDKVLNLVKKFVTTLDDYISEMNTIISKNDLVKLKEISHKLKGAAANFRLKPISSIAETIENNSKNNLEVDYNKLLNNLKTEIEIIKDCLEMRR